METNGHLEKTKKNISTFRFGSYFPLDSSGFLGRLHSSDTCCEMYTMIYSVCVFIHPQSLLLHLPPPPLGLSPLDDPMFYGFSTKQGHYDLVFIPPPFRSILGLHGQGPVASLRGYNSYLGRRSTSCRWCISPWCFPSWQRDDLDIRASACVRNGSVVSCNKQTNPPNISCNNRRQFMDSECNKLRLF